MAIRTCRWGILSTAVITNKNWQAIQMAGNGQVVAVASRNLERSQQFVDELQAAVPFAEKPVAYGSYDELIADNNVDAIYIPLPTGIRKQWVIAAANAGKHVLCEKPCAVSSADLAEMIDACADNNVQFMDGVMFMHSNRYREIRKVLDDGRSVGDIKRIHMNFSFNAPEQFRSDNIRTASDLEPQGALGDLGWYCIRFALWVKNYELPQYVSGRILDDIHRDGGQYSVPMEFSGELVWADGSSASFYNSFQTTMQQWANVSGTNGFLQIPDFVLPFYGNQLSFFVNNAQFVEEGCDFRMENFEQHYSVAEHGNGAPNAQEANLFHNFSELVITDTVDEHWPEISMKTQIVLDACLESGRNGSAKQEINQQLVTTG